MTTEHHSRRTIRFADATGQFAHYLQESLLQLCEQLQKHYPQLDAIQLDPMPAGDSDELFQDLTSQLSERLQSAECETATSDRLFILCPPDHPFVAAAQLENPRAHWGIALPCRFAVAWVINPYLWWHEALHLFNAKDCYNKFGIHKCPEPHCVMQASPTRSACGGRLYLCSKNLRRLSDELRLRC